ncbi:uncharacterized protein LOC141826353 [Curcuma longa]|uniref:uncharacterized protein LOC141826353 n=1 Tax=Curcuma longa TaxID=136217 RepID=UPI003D9EEAB8
MMIESRVVLFRKSRVVITSGYLPGRKHRLWLSILAFRVNCDAKTSYHLSMRRRKNRPPTEVRQREIPITSQASRQRSAKLLLLHARLFLLLHAQRPEAFSRDNRESKPERCCGFFSTSTRGKGGRRRKHSSPTTSSLRSGTTLTRKGRGRRRSPRGRRTLTRLAPSIFLLLLLPAPLLTTLPLSLPPSSLSLSLSVIIFAVVMVMEQEQDEQGQRNYKHYCRICKKGFVCGRALGGHMRAHGLMDDAAGFSAVETSGDGEWDHEKVNGAGAKRMYALRSKPSRLKSCRVCENCGKEFVSWKSFLEHGKCVSGDGGAIGHNEHERESSLASSPRSGDDELVGWSKGKRSRRTKVAMSEEEDLANCLVLLSSARVDTVSGLIDESEESCDSAIKEDRQRKDTINATATGAVEAAATAPKALLRAFTLPTPPAVPKGLFECKACKKVFASHQALGGHRASHKKVKGCFAAKLNALDETPPPPDNNDPVIATHNRNNAGNSYQMGSMPMSITSIDNPAPLAVAPVSKKKPKVHECSICQRVFTSGQALGGHKRCHWITPNSPPDPTLKLQPLPDRPGLRQQLTLRPTLDANSISDHFDFNVPPINGGSRSHIGCSLRLDTPAAIYLRSWTNDHEHASKNRTSVTTSSDMNNNNGDQKHTITDLLKATMGEDEVDSKVKLAKLSELKDINMGEEESSDWLQVGIGSSAKEGSEA